MRLDYCGVKGRSESIELAPVTVVVGDNWSGKTSALTALRLALIGYEPSLDRTARGVWQLASGKEMSVELTLPSGFTVDRTWAMDRGTVKCNTMLPDGWVMPPGLVDVREFLGLSAAKRAEYILGLVPVPAAATAGLESVGDTTDVREFMAHWCVERNIPVSQWLAELATELKGRVSLAKAEATEAEAATRRYVTEDAPAFGKDQSQEIARLRVEEAALNQRLGAERAALAAEVAAKQLEARIESVLAQAEAQAADSDCIRFRAAIEARPGAIEFLESEIAGLDVKGAALSRLLKDEIARLEKLTKTGLCPLCGCDADPQGTLEAKLQQSVEELTRQLNNITERLAPLRVSLAGLKRGRERDQDCARHRTTVTQLIASRVTPVHQQVDLLGDPVDPDPRPLAEQLEDLRASIVALTANQRAWEQGVARAKHQAKIEQDSAAARASLAAWTDALKAVVAVRDDAVEDAFDSFADKIRLFTDGITDFTLKVRDGELGYFRDGGWVSHEVLSGSETALVYAGLSVALAAGAPVKIVIIDELLLDAKRKALVADRMRDLAARGVIDAFITVDVSHEGWPDWVNFVNV